jgi:hypothetical protein
MVLRQASGLSQSEIAGNENHHNNNTNDVKNIHVRVSFPSRERITAEADQMAVDAIGANENIPSPHHRSKTTLR